MNELKWDKRFLDLAKLVGSWSKDPSTQVGAVIVRPDKSIASCGFNGFAQKMPDDHELYANRDEKYSRIIHAEMNALLFTREPVIGYTLYTYPFIPCDRCFVTMVQAGITKYVAPKATKEQLIRWKEFFDKTYRYAAESGVEIKTLDN